MTTLDIESSSFLINGTPTLKGRTYQGISMEGLLPNSRMIQGIFDDENPETRSRWNYPDGPWDAERNTREFVAAMPEWRKMGLLAFTLGMQGGSPQGYSREQPWINSAYTPDGEIKQAYLDRLERILAAADALGMVVILSLFYFGQEPRFQDEAAVLKAQDQTVEWLIQKKYRHVLIEIANETDHPAYRRSLFSDEGAASLIRRVQEQSAGRVANRAGRFYVGTSFLGGARPSPCVTSVSDLILIHGNGVDTPAEITRLVEDTRALPAYRGQPVVINEDDHFDFDQPDHHMLAAFGAGAGWGYFDYRLQGESDFHQGYQSMPCDWRISSPRKRAFFQILQTIQGPV